MFIPIWLIATFIYIAAMVFTVWRGERQMSAYDFGTPFLMVLALLAETIAYLIFWIIYLAV